MTPTLAGQSQVGEVSLLSCRVDSSANIGAANGHQLDYGCTREGEIMQHTLPAVAKALCAKFFPTLRFFQIFNGKRKL